MHTYIDSRPDPAYFSPEGNGCVQALISLLAYLPIAVIGMKADGFRVLCSPFPSAVCAKKLEQAWLLQQHPNYASLLTVFDSMKGARFKNRRRRTHSVFQN